MLRLPTPLLAASRKAQPAARHRDILGVAVSTDRTESIAGYERALASLLNGHGDPAAEIERTLSRDPRFVMGYALRAALLVMAADESVEAALARTLRAALAVRDRANDRERRHLAAAKAWLDRDLLFAIKCYGEILHDYPHDVLALRVAHSGDFQLDQADQLRDRVAQVLPYWDESMPHYSFVLGMHAFGLEEGGRYAEAEAAGRRALALNPRNPGAIHAIAHVMEMQGRAREGIEWLTRLAPQWTDSTYAAHLWWHLALFHLDLDHTERALAVYDQFLQPLPQRGASTLVDASALLWRLHLRGVNLEQRWAQLADVWEAKRIEGLRPFNDVHAMLAFVAAGRGASARKLVADLRASATRSQVLDGVIRNSALPVCQALLAFGRGDHAVAVERLTTVQHLMQRCGGSKAQCDLLHLTLLEAALRARRARLAHMLISERIARKPTSVFNRRLQSHTAKRILGNRSSAMDASLGAI